MLTPRSRRADARPDEILDSALKAFRARGFDAARMEDVARGAGISKAGVYLYFESKEALLKALILREVKPIPEAAQAAAASQGSVRDGLYALSAFAHAHARDPLVFAVPRLLLSVADRYPDLARFYREEVIEVGRVAIRALIEKGIERGEFRPVDPEAAVRAVMGPILFEGVWSNTFGGRDGDPVRIARAHIDLLLLGLEASR